MIRHELDRRPLAFLTMDSLAGFISSDHLAVAPLSQLGWEVRDVSWRAPDVDWNEFTAVVIRSPWDYHHHLDAFLEVLQQIDASSALLLNPLDVVRWNVNKTYMRDLQKNGVRIVPTVWSTSPTHTDLAAALQTLDCSELVIKPTVGAGARDTFRWNGSTSEPDTQQLVDCYRDRLAMLQPFVESIVNIGEWSHFFFDAGHSHTVLKKPKRGDFRAQEEHGSWLRLMDAPPQHLELAKQALSVPGRELAYARVDIVELADGEPAIIELELVEPSLYFPYDDESPNRFARALDDILHRQVAPRTA